MRQWQILEPILPAEKPGGRHRLYELREIINALRYLLRTGCSWRLIPHDFPHWRAVYEYLPESGETMIYLAREQFDVAAFSKQNAIRSGKSTKIKTKALITHFLNSL